jgi:hypothetical protein
MGLIKEPKDIDFSKKSEPWTDQELAEFRELMKAIRKQDQLKKSKKIIQIKNRNKATT